MQSSRHDEFERHLRAALVTRPVIEQAKGVLIGLRSATPEQAYEELRYVSMSHNIKLCELAEALLLAAARRLPRGSCLAPVIWQEWGDVLPGAAQSDECG